MHTLRNALAALLLAPCILLAAPPALEWRADLADTGAATLYARHGDEIGLACRLTLRGAPYAPATALCHYQTNGMGAAWWEAPVTLSSNVATVAWSPALDPGADLILLLLEFDGAHRAAAHLHLRPGPSGGSALPPPTQVLDFAVAAWTNAPWATTNDIAEAAAEATGHADALFGRITALTNAFFCVSGGGVLSLYHHGTNVWSSATLPDGAATTNDIAAALRGVNRRWGDWTADGAPNPDPDAVVLNRAEAVVASGFTLSTSGAYAVLSSSGAVSYIEADGGSSRWSLDATNYVALAHGGTVVVGAHVDGIRTEPGAGGATLVHLQFPHSGGDYPCIWYATSLAGEWQQIDPAAIVWVAADGVAECTFSTSSDSGFFRATTTADLGAVFRSSVPIEPTAGILVPGAATPVRYDSVITIPAGGRTYRIPAQLVE